MGERRTHNNLEDRIKKGKDGENAFQQWLKENEFPYLFVDQSKETFPPLFRQNLKRPDFLVLLESIGMIAVDVKNHDPQPDGAFTINAEELAKALAFERVFRIPVWYAYRESILLDDVWYWISALKCLEVAKECSGRGGKYLKIARDDFEKVCTGSDIGKLFMQRLRSLGNIKSGRFLVRF